MTADDGAPPPRAGPLSGARDDAGDRAARAYSGPPRARKWSLSAFREALDRKTISGADRRVLLALASYCGDSDARVPRVDRVGYYCWPSIASIAGHDHVCMSPRSVQRALRRLEQRGAIIVVRSRGRVSSRYYVAARDALPHAPVRRRQP